jgi:predicted enzyme related to lactoylglutathione lyase
MEHAVVRFEIGATDQGSLVAFYGGLFDWTLQASADGHTTIDTRAAGINGGIGPAPAGQAWSAFCVETEDPQATLDKATALGGTTVMPVTDLDGGVRLALFRDLDGLPVGLVRAPAAAPATGADPAEAVDWFEVMGSDAARTQDFYAELFGWKLDRSGLPDYAVVDATGTGRGIWGGIGGGVDATWTIVYAGVSDVDQALRRAEELGGSRVAAPGVTALKNAARTALYGSADDVNMAVFRDPAGNVFGVYHKLT